MPLHPGVKRCWIQITRFHNFIQYMTTAILTKQPDLGKACVAPEKAKCKMRLVLVSSGHIMALLMNAETVWRYDNTSYLHDTFTYTTFILLSKHRARCTMHWFHFTVEEIEVHLC